MRKIATYDLTGYLTRYVIRDGNETDVEVEVTTEELLGDEWYYYRLLTNYNDVERYNFQSDYWEDADTYQEENLELMRDIEDYIGEMCYANVYGERIEGVLKGILIDKKYNSVGHTMLLLSDAEEERTGRRNKRSMRKKAFIDINKAANFIKRIENFDYDCCGTYSDNRSGYFTFYDEDGIYTLFLEWVIRTDFSTKWIAILGESGQECVRQSGDIGLMCAREILGI